MKKRNHGKQAVDPNETRASSLEADTLTDASSLDERIRKRAYEIHQARGGAPGQDLDDWLQAEREIKVGMNQGSDPTA